MRLRRATSLLLFMASLQGGERIVAASAVTGVTADPSLIQLHGNGAIYSILVHGKTAAGQWVDLTRKAQFQSVDPEVATVSERGIVTSIHDGKTTVAVEVGGRKIPVSILVEGCQQAHRYNFENDIIPILSRFGCNSSGCHGKAEGQNGFKLSVFGFDPAADFAALTSESRGRRILPVAPDHSLVLAKMSGAIPHGGGRRIARGTAEYDLILGWIAAGAPYGDGSDPKVLSVRVEPGERQLAMRSEQQLRVIARYTDQHEADVTFLSKFQSNNDGLAAVDDRGLVTCGTTPGDVAIMASYMGSVDVFRAIVPRPEAIPAYPALRPANFIDTLVGAKLRKLNILPSDLSDDAEFLRRVYLDIIGTLPTSAEARHFLSDRDPDRRQHLVDHLLQRPEFGDYWALKWSDVLRVDRQLLGSKHAYRYYQWIRESMASNKPFDQFAREILTAEGPVQENASANFYKAVPRAGDAAATLSQVFLGIRIACAECHHHPFDRWSQDDYYGMQAFFSQVSLRSSTNGEELMVGSDSPTINPRTKEAVRAHVLGSSTPGSQAEGDRRLVLAKWLTDPANPWFARNVANRVWAHLLGRGLVEPVDDVRATNPPTNPELLDALAKNFIENKYDLRQLIRSIAASHCYQSSSRPNRTNESDEQNYSRALFKRIDAEVLLDMVSQTTGIGEKFSGIPPGYRAIQLWDSKVSHYFLKLFGRPVRASACECERNIEPGVSQVLHILNSPEIHAKLAHEGGYVARLVRERPDNAALVDDLYLSFFSRFPTVRERKQAVEYLQRDVSSRRQAVEDLAWAMMNSLEFIFNH